MSRKPKPIQFRMDPPFDHYEVDLFPVHYHGDPEPSGYSVGVMNREEGRGHRYSVEYAEALAKAILKATRLHRRREAAKASDAVSS
jgi:hypothetical protein